MKDRKGKGAKVDKRNELVKYVLKKGEVLRQKLCDYAEGEIKDVITRSASAPKDNDTQGIIIEIIEDIVCYFGNKDVGIQDIVISILITARTYYIIQEEYGWKPLDNLMDKGELSPDGAEIVLNRLLELTLDNIEQIVDVAVEDLETDDDYYKILGGFIGGFCLMCLNNLQQEQEEMAAMDVMMMKLFSPKRKDVDDKN